MKLSHKQTIIIDYLEDNITTEAIFGGAAGGGKSALGCYYCLKTALKYAGSRGLIGRAELKTLKETTLVTFFEIAQKQGLKPNIHFTYNGQSGIIKLFNGSEILTKDLFQYPSDPNFDSLGSLEITYAFIDECNQITEKAWNIVMSRIRYKLDEFGIIPKILGTCNPAKNWVYSKFFVRHKNGTLPNNMQFVQSLVTDNPFISNHYKENLAKLDEASKQRLLLGNWDYDDKTSLYQFGKLNDLVSNTFVERGKQYMTADIAMEGSDRFVIFNWDGRVIVNCDIIEKSNGKDIEVLIKANADKYNVPQSHIVYDSDGVGKFLKGYLPNAIGFVNNGTPAKVDLQKENYANAKAQCYYISSQKVNDNKIYILPEVANFMYQGRRIIDWLVEELGVVKRAKIDQDGKLYINSKEDMKSVLGRSPDFADAFMMREWLDLNKITFYFK